MDTEMLIGFGLAAVMGLITFFAILKRGNAADDPSNADYIRPEKLSGAVDLLENCEYQLSFFRQSGNEYKAPVVVRFASEAISLLTSTLKRAKIDNLQVITNSEKELNIKRATHSHGGKAEGKKLGRIEIKAVRDLEPEEVVIGVLKRRLSESELNQVQVVTIEGKLSIQTKNKEILPKISKILNAVAGVSTDE